MVHLDAPLRELLALPPRSDPVRRLLELMDDPDASLAELGQVMDLDPATATRAIYLANSTFYALRTPAVTSARALGVIGLTTARALVASAFYGLRSPHPGEVPPGSWPWAVASAAACRTIARRLGADDPAEAFSLGLLHDVGATLLHRRDRERYHRVLVGAAGDPDRQRRDEHTVFGTDHATLGAAALQATRFPAAFVDAVRHHHDPTGRGELDLLLRTGLVLAAAVQDHGGPDAPTGLPATLERAGIPAAAAPVLVREARTAYSELAHALAGSGRPPLQV